jgi:L-alanine-DL-glutamate epimerase-like enolase superfamily enzyme
VKVSAIETLACDAGWRNYHFVKLTTSEGIVGWSEFSEDFGSPGIGAIIAKLAAKVLGQTASNHERIYAELYAATRPAAGGVVAQAIAAIENALLDAKAKALGVPCYVLLGGKLRNRIPLYWSHCATWRINHATYYKPEIKDLDDVKAIGREVREKGFKAAKTNIFIYEDGKNPRGWRPGFGSPYYPELNVDSTVLRNLHLHLEALRDGLGPDLGLLLDLNFNAKTEGYLKSCARLPTSTCSGSRSILTRRKRSAISAAKARTRSRRAARLARVPSLLQGAGDGCCDHRHAVEWRVAIDEDRRVCGGARAQRRAA